MPDLTIGPARPAMPYAGVGSASMDLATPGAYAGGLTPIHLERHHVIPASLLITLWNRILGNGHLVHCTALLTALANNIIHYNTNIHNIDAQAAATAVAGILTGATQHDANDARPTWMDDFDRIFVNLPGNLFIGPHHGNGVTRRADDPGDGFEEQARNAVGDALFDHLIDAFNAINRYLGSNALPDLTAACHALAGVAAENQPRALDPGSWLHTGAYGMNSYSLT